jgi:hypothetical protein
METCPNIRKYRFYNVIVALNRAFFVENRYGVVACFGGGGRLGKPSRRFVSVASAQ